MDNILHDQCTARFTQMGYAVTKTGPYSTAALLVKYYGVTTKITDHHQALAKRFVSEVALRPTAEHKPMEFHPLRPRPDWDRAVARSRAYVLNGVVR